MFYRANKKPLHLIYAEAIIFIFNCNLVNLVVSKLFYSSNLLEH